MDTFRCYKNLVNQCIDIKYYFLKIHELKHILNFDCSIHCHDKNKSHKYFVCVLTFNMYFKPSTFKI